MEEVGGGRKGRDRADVDEGGRIAFSFRRTRSLVARRGLWEVDEEKGGERKRS